MQHLAKKLQLKPERTILTLQAPQEFIEQLEKEGYTVITDVAIQEPSDAVQLFVNNKAELGEWAPKAVEKLKPQGLLWIAYPKKSSGATSDLSRDEDWGSLFALEYEPVRQIAIDAIWSSLRFKHQSERKTPSKYGATYDGIDSTTRTVIAPHDLKLALEQAGLLSNFELLAFTSKKEIVVSLLEAKRPETRANRVLKAVAQVKATVNNQEAFLSNNRYCS